MSPSEYAKDPKTYVRNTVVSLQEDRIGQTISELKSMAEPDARVADILFLLDEVQKRLEGYRKDEPRRSLKFVFTD